MDGVLVIDKPAGPTSHDLVALVRRVTGWSKVGHTGTLDPLATGVLPLVVGRATRLAQFLTAADKVYEAEVRIGWATDTYDAEGKRIEISSSESPNVPPSPDGFGGASREPAVSALLPRFLGTFVQAPPPFSAKKVGGVRAYSLARNGQPVEPKRVPVTVHEIACLGVDGDRVRVRIRCSAGFYVRSFAHDLGIALGTGAHLSALRRTRSGDFGATDAVPLDRLQSADAALAALVPMERLLVSLPAVVVTEAGAVRTRHGNDLRPSDVVSWPAAEAARGPVRVLDPRGSLLAIGEPSKKPGLLHPGVVVG